MFELLYLNKKKRTECPLFLSYNYDCLNLNLNVTVSSEYHECHGVLNSIKFWLQLVDLSSLTDQDSRLSVEKLKVAVVYHAGAVDQYDELYHTHNVILFHITSVFQHQFV